MKIHYSIYADIDTIFDTRIATLFKYYPDLVEYLLENDLYHTRDTDAFGDLKRSEFYELYKKRDVSILKGSVRTEILTVIARILLEMEEKRIEMPFMQMTQLHVNTYPYFLTEEDKIDIKEALHLFFEHKLVAIDLVSLPPLLVSPTYIRSNFEFVFMYDWVEWVDLHKDNLIKDNCMEVEFILPALYTDDVIDRKAIKEVLKTKETPFSSLQLILAGMIKARFINPGAFSFSIPKKVKA